MTSSVCRCSSTISARGRPAFGTLLHARRSARRAARRRRDRHSRTTSSTSSASSSEHGRLELRPRVRRRAHAAPLRALQQRPEVRDAARPRARPRRRRAGDRPLRARRPARRTGRWLLKRSADPEKDQSYFLFSLTQEQLARAPFPGRASRQGRRCAPTRGGSDLQRRRQAGQPGDLLRARRRLRRVRRAARRPSAARAGAIVDATATVLGAHGGVHRFTVGQRKGLGLSAHARRSTCWRSSRTTRQVVVGPRDALERDDADGVAA